MVENTYALSLYDEHISALILIQCWDNKERLRDIFLNKSDTVLVLQ